MIPRAKGKRSQLFTLRLWAEDTAEGQAELRGKIQRVESGETLYFREWDPMLAFLSTSLPVPNRTHTQQGEDKQGLEGRR
jgi:hypothetical protein